MRAGMVCLLLTILCGVLHAADAKPAAPAKKPAAPKKPPEESLKFGRDGSIERVGGKKDGVVTRYWQVNHDQPSNLQKELTPFLGAGVTIRARGQNLLMIEAPSEKWPIIEKLLEVLDVPAPQVYVEAKIIEIKYESNLEFGFEATYDRRAATEATQPFFGTFTGIFNPESYLESLGTSTPFQGGTFEFENVGDSTLKRGQYSYTLRALQQRGEIEILSQPSIIATQGKKAKITTGISFPVQSVDVKGNQTYVTTDFKKTGILLELTPSLIGRGYVTLTINAEDSQITDSVPGPSGALNPIISERTATTDVSVRDGQTIIIGGLLSSSTVETKSGIPLISDIPLLGYLFSSTRTEKKKSELVFFITPRIIKREEQTIILPPGERTRMNK